MIAFTDKTLTVYQGDVLACLANMPDNSVHCVVTSPPYWGLRDYGVQGQIGLEKTPDEFVANMVAVFREVRRVLRPDGTVWLNIGDSYANDAKWGGESGAKNYTSAAGGYSRERKYTGLKPKDLCMIPERLALALQADGWWVRSEIIWAKPNPMPESVTDRPTKAHEKIYLLTKSANYYYDAEAVKEDSAGRELFGNSRKIEHKDRNDCARNDMTPTQTRNLRTVWTMATQAYSEAHFATFPEELPRKCIMAGTSEKGVCPDCGAPWERVVEKPKAPDALCNKGNGSKMDYHSRQTGSGQKLQDFYNENPAVTTGWRPTCKCGREDTVPATVLDPFGGSGTTGKVANDLGRKAVLIELNPEYIAMMLRRNKQPSLI